MKSTLKKLVTGAFALALVAPFAIAEPGDKDGDRKGPRGTERPDRPRGERPAPPKTVEEFKTRLAENERFKGFITKRFGGDDGVLSDEEIAAAFKKLKERGARGPGKGKGKGKGKGPRGGGDGPDKGKGKGKGPRPEAEL